MLIVETIAKIRRAYFVQGKSIKAICRELRVSRKTVRKVIRSDETEFSYERSFQPQPKIGPWRDELDRLLAANAARPSRERLTLTRIFEELRGLGYDGGYDAVRRYAADWKRQASEATAAAYVPSRGTRASGTTLRPRRGIPVRLEPRGRGDRRRHDDGEGRARPALPQPDDVRAGLSARDAGDGVRRPRQGVRLLRRGLHPGHLRQRGGSASRPVDGSPAERRRRSTRSSRAGSAPTTAASSKCAVTTWSNPWPARPPPAGRRDRSRTRWAWSGAASSRPGFGRRATRSSTPGWPTAARRGRRPTATPRSRSERSGRCSRRSGRASCPIAVPSTASMPCRRPSRRPAWFASTRTSIRSPPRRSGARWRSGPMPTGSRSARTAAWSASTGAPSAAAGRSTIPGTTCPCWPASRGR